MMEFVNRVREIRAVEDLLARPEPGLVRLYGRRRLGKTELLRRVAARGGGLYLLIDDADRPQVLESLARQIARAKQDLVVPLRDWDAFFLSLPKLGFPFIVLDELQYLVDNDRQAVSRLQAHWDTTLRKAGPSIVLCGSSVGMMQRITRTRSGPLFGRLTGDLRLRPFRYGDVRLLYPDLDEVEIVRRYAIFGGTPFYHRFSVQSSLEDAVKQSFLQTTAPFQEEPQNLLRLELKAPVRYNSILYEIGQGSHYRRELENKVGVKSGGLGPYLDLLKSDLDLLRMEDPICGAKRPARYVFADPFFAFYYRFVFQNRPRIELDRQDDVWRDIQTELDHYIGAPFERVAQDSLRALNGTSWNGVPIEFDRIGRWWNRIGEEIDIVAEGKDVVLVGEVKWSKHPVDVALLERLLQKAEHIERLDGRPVRPVAFSRSGFSDGASEWLTEHAGLALELDDFRRIYAPETGGAPGGADLLHRS